MSLTSGSRLGPYEIIAPIGAGGMGEVFRARDTKLGRDVAIKVLPTALAQDVERVGRFRREAQILATLNHSNIAAIYGLEEANGTVGLVMELVAGDDLAQRLRNGAIPVDEATSIARQIAEALEEAHEKGIVHRDLKPANVKVTPDGRVKVLDFGLAKALEGETFGNGADSGLSHSPTMSRHATEAGLILGTAAYMSPEQARGKTVDKRADIWSFGVVLFEMLTGERLYSGETVSDTLAAVLREDVPWKRLPPQTPPALVQLLRRCLVRDPRQRLRDIGEARLALDAKSNEDQGPVAPAPAPRGGWLGWLAATVVIAAIAGGLAWQSRAPRPASEKRLAILSPTDAPPQQAEISPDARKVAILADDKVWLRQLDRFSATEVLGSEGARNVFWSRDSAQIGFQSRGQLWRVSIDGGTPIAIGPVQDFTPAGSAAWEEASRIVFSTGTSSLMEMKVEGGGSPRELMTLDPSKDVDVHEPSLLPGGKDALFALHPTSAMKRAIQVWSGGERRTLFSTNTRLSNPRYSPTGHVLFDMDGSVWAIPFSRASMSSSGDPVLVAEHARRPSIAGDGTIVMLSGSASTSLALTWVSATGKAGALISKKRATQPRISPDGRLVAAMVGFVGFGSDADIWILDPQQGTERRLSFEPEADTVPGWSPDGRFVVYQCGSSACARPADGTGARVVLVANATNPVVSPDGKRLVFRREGATDAGIYSVEIGATGLKAPLPAAPRLLVATRGSGDHDISPDGRFLAYSTRDDGSDALFVTTFPAAEGRWEIPVRQAVEPHWSADGSRLFALDDLSRVVEVPVALKGPFSAGRPEVRVTAVGLQRGSGYDRTRAGEFLLPLPPSALDTQTRILMIQNWSPK